MDMLLEDVDKTATYPVMQSSFEGSTIEEEEFIDNVDPDLIISASSEACSSLFASDSGLDHPDEREHEWEEKNNSIDEGITTSPVNSSSQNFLQSAGDEAPRPTRSSTPKSKLSLSMHDISEIPTYPLTGNSNHDSSSTIQSQSMTTDASVPKSKDSGFPRSVSCFSLNSSKRYDHVQSKVKKYISQIKQENSSSRSSKNVFNLSIDSKNVPAHLENSNSQALSVAVLIPVIDKLKGQLEDKDRMLLKLQENYDNLLMEFAAAKNRIDYLRISSASAEAGSPMPFSFDVTSYKKPKASKNILLLPELDKLLNVSIDFENLLKPKIELKLPKQEHLKSFANELKPNDSPVSVKKDSQCAMNLEVANHNITSRGDDKELSPERLNRQIADNPFVKVKRWQDSLPSYGLIEPNSYDSLPSTSNSTNPGKSDSACSKQSNLYSTKDDASSNCNASNFILYSRSISQPNNISSQEDLGLSMDMNQANSLLSLSSAQFSSSSFKCGAESATQGFDFDINKTLSLDPNLRSSNTGSKHNYQLCHQRYLRIPESSHPCRKKVVNWKAKNILFEHMKELTCHRTISLSRSLPLAEVNRVSQDYNVEELNLANHLDEVNQCAKNLNGESKAIMQALAKQLKASNSNLNLTS